ncbi:MAG: Do family serine endopeptidase [Planctomycetota bacterium]
MPTLLKSAGFALASMLFGSLLTLAAISLPSSRQSLALADQIGGPRLQSPASTSAIELSNSFHQISQMLQPSVVSISTKQARLVRGSRMDQLFGLPPQRQESTGMGSGVVIRSDGYIATNNHVVKEADELMVELHDGRRASATIIGTDPETDLAVIKVDLQGLQAAMLGDSDAMRIGDWVLAIGSPFGLDQTVTAGIISGKHRDQDIISDEYGFEGFEDFLQTDAAINPGNSGGALVNMRGELVGINTAILSKSGSSAGVGFAIPIQLATPVLNSLIESGEMKRGFLGVSIGDVNPDLVKRFGLRVRSGAFISGIGKGQPAALAGIQPGDVVVAMDGRPISSGGQLRNNVANRSPGSIVRLQIDRGGDQLTIPVTLQEREDPILGKVREMFQPGGAFGATLVPVTPEAVRRLQYNGLENGLIVAGVRRGGLANQAGLRAGDILLEVDKVPLTSVDQLIEAFVTSTDQRQPLRVTVLQGNEKNYIVFRP